MEGQKKLLGCGLQEGISAQSHTMTLAWALVLLFEIRNHMIFLNIKLWMFNNIFNVFLLSVCFSFLLFWKNC